MNCIILKMLRTHAQQLFIRASSSSSSSLSSLIHQRTVFNKLKLIIHCSHNSDEHLAHHHNRQNHHHQRRYSTKTDLVDINMINNRDDIKKNRTMKDVVVLYKGPKIKIFRLLIRFKLLQVVSIGAVATPVLALINSTTGESLSALNQIMGTLSVFGAIGCSLALQQFSNRYVGELALIKRSDKEEQNKIQLKISSMDFWAKRIETVVDYPGNVLPPLKNVPESALVDVANASFLPLDVLVGNDGENKKQFMISLRHGELVDKRKLLNMLSGKIDPFV